MQKVFIGVAAVLAVGCGPKPEIFDGVNRAAAAVISATAVGVTYQKMGELVIALATEIELAAQKATHDAELAVMTELTAAIDAYRDAQEVWSIRIKNGLMLTKYDGLEPYATKYRVASVSGTRNDLWNAETVMREAWVIGERRLQSAQNRLKAMR